MKYHVIFLLFLGSLGLYSQEAPVVSVPGTTQYYLKSVDLSIDGFTQPSLLKQKLGLKEGTTFSSVDRWNRFLEDLNQKLVNVRTIDTFEIEQIQTQEEDGRIAVNLNIKVKDSWNIIVLPKPEYSTNTGFLLSLRGRDYNFLGTMEPLRLDLNYEFDEFDRVIYGVDTEFKVPFSAWTWDWVLALNQSLQIRPDFPVYWKGEVLLEASKDLDWARWTLVAGERVEINPFNDEGQEEPFQGTHSLESALTFPLLKSDLGDLDYKIGTRTEVQNVAGAGVSALYGALEQFFYHELTYGGVNWKGSLRDGVHAEAVQTGIYDFLHNEWRWSQEAFGEFHSAHGWFGFSSRVGFLHYGVLPEEDLGSFVRGIIDKRVEAWAAAYFNLEAPVRLLEFVPSRWFGWDWARFSEFDFFVSPVVDGMIDSAGKTWVGSGAEFLIFSHFIKSFYIRVSIAFDAQSVWENKSLGLKALTTPSTRDQGDVREVFIGLGWFY